jgi:hypothetical protein
MKLVRVKNERPVAAVVDMVEDGIAAVLAEEEAVAVVAVVVVAAIGAEDNPRLS